MVNHISKCSKLAKKECKTKHNWVGKVIYWELCQKLKFDHTTKSVLDNEMHKILWDCEGETDCLIPARRPDLVLIGNKKRIYCLMSFVVLADHRVKIKESEKIDKYLDFARELKKCGM